MLASDARLAQIRRTRSALKEHGLSPQSGRELSDYWLGVALEIRERGYTNIDAFSETLRAEGSTLTTWFREYDARVGRVDKQFSKKQAQCILNRLQKLAEM